MARYPSTKIEVPPSPEDQEADFLTELLDGYKKWVAIGNKEYAEAYRVLIHNFTNVEPSE